LALDHSVNCQFRYSTKVNYKMHFQHRAVPVVLAWLVSVFAVSAAMAQSYTDIEADQFDTCALTTGGEIECVSTDPFGVRATVPESDLPWVELSVGTSATCARNSDGGVLCWGENRFGQTEVTVERGPFSEIDVGGNHACAVTQTGEAVCWGLNDKGQADAPEFDVAVLQVTAGSTHSCALMVDGRVTCWGDAGKIGVLGIDAPLTLINSGAEHTCGIRTDQTLVCWGAKNFDVNFQPPGLDLGPVLDVAVAIDSTCAIETSGALKCWKPRNSIGFEATTPSGDEPYIAVEVAGPGICAIGASGRIDCNDRPGRTHYKNYGFAGDRLPPPQPHDVQVFNYGPFGELLYNSGEFRNPCISYEIYRDGELLLTTTNGNSVQIDTTSLQTSRSYAYTVVALDCVGQRSEPSLEVLLSLPGDNETPPDNSNYQPKQFPLTPTGIETLIYSTTAIEIIWDRPPITARLFGYEIYRNGEFIRFINGTSYFDDTLELGKVYSYVITGIDINQQPQGNRNVIVSTNDSGQCLAN